MSCLLAFCLPVGARLFPLICESIDGWYSLADAAGADDDGGSGRIASWSVTMYVSSLARFGAVPELTPSTDLISPLLLVIADDVVDARLGAELTS